MAAIISVREGPLAVFGETDGKSYLVLGENTLEARRQALLAKQYAESAGGDVSAGVEQAQAWAEGITPGGAGTKSAREYASDLAASTGQVQASATLLENAKALRATGYAGSAIGSTNDALVIQTAVPLAAYPAYASLDFVAPFTTTRSVLASIDGLPNRGLIREDGVSIGAGDLIAGRRYTLAVTPTEISVRGNLGRVLSQATTLRVSSYTGSTANALLIATAAPGISALPSVWSMWVQIPTGNTNTGAVTIAIDGLTAINLTRDDGGSSLPAGALVAGSRYLIMGSSTTARVQGAGTAKTLSDHMAATNATLSLNAASIATNTAKSDASYSALLSDPKLVYEHALTSTYATSQNLYDFAGIVSTEDVAAGTAFNAVGGNVAVHADTTSIIVSVWRRTNLGLTSGPGAAGDTLLGSFTYSPAQLGITPGGAAFNTRVALPQSYSLAAGEGIIVEFDARGTSNTRVPTGIGKTGDLINGPDTRRGWYRAGVSSGSYSLVNSTGGVHVWLGLVEILKMKDELAALRNAVPTVSRAEATRGPTTISRDRFAGVAVPSGWSLGAGWSVNAGLIAPAAAGWGAPALNGRISTARRRITRAIVEVANAGDTFGICFKPPSATPVNGQACMVNGAQGRIELCLWDGTATAGTMRYSTAMPALVPGRLYGLEAVQFRRKSTFTLRDLVTQEVTVVTGNYGSPNADAGRQMGQAGILSISGAVKVHQFEAYTNSPQSPDAVLLGDSITEGVSLRETSTTSPIAYDSCWSYQLEDAAGGSILTCARGGQTSADILARLTTDHDPFNPRYVMLLAGTNDTLGGTALAVTRANIAAIIARIEARGAIPILATIPPINTKATEVSAFNADIRSYYYGRYRFVDFARALSAGHDGVTWNTAYQVAGEDSTLGAFVHPNLAAQVVMLAQVRIDAPMLLD